MIEQSSYKYTYSTASPMALSSWMVCPDGRFQWLPYLTTIRINHSNYWPKY